MKTALALFVLYMIYAEFNDWRLSKVQKEIRTIIKKRYNNYLGNNLEALAALHYQMRLDIGDKRFLDHLKKTESNEQLFGQPNPKLSRPTTPSAEIESILTKRYNNFQGTLYGKLKPHFAFMREQMGDEVFLRYLVNREKENPRPVFVNPLEHEAEGFIIKFLAEQKKHEPEQ